MVRFINQTDRFGRKPIESQEEGKGREEEKETASQSDRPTEGRTETLVQSPPPSRRGDDNMAIRIIQDRNTENCLGMTEKGSVHHQPTGRRGDPVLTGTRIPI